MQFKTIILVALGFIFLGIGAIGLFLPIWPTTPFVLLAVGCFSTAPRIKQWVLKIPFFKDHIENYENRTGLSNKTFWFSMIWLWGMLILSMFLIQKFWMTMLLLLVGTSVTIHILYMTKAREKKKGKAE